MGSFLHPMRRIVTLIRDNMAQLRQVESGTREVERSSGKTAGAKNTDPKLAQIAGQFSHFEIKKSRGGYLIYNPRCPEPIARLRPFPNTDRFELFYWSKSSLVPKDIAGARYPFLRSPTVTRLCSHVVSEKSSGTHAICLGC